MYRHDSWQEKKSGKHFVHSKKEKMSYKQIKLNFKSLSRHNLIWFFFIEGIQFNFDAFMTFPMYSVTRVGLKSNRINRVFFASTQSRWYNLTRCRSKQYTVLWSQQKWKKKTTNWIYVQNDCAERFNEYFTCCIENVRRFEKAFVCTVKVKKLAAILPREKSVFVRWLFQLSPAVWQ